jgi:hypothetical protein
LSSGVFGCGGEVGEDDALAGSEPAEVAAELAGFELAVPVELDEVLIAGGIGEGIPGTPVAGNAVNRLIAGEVEGAEFAGAIEGGGDAVGEAEAAGAADAVSIEDGGVGEGEVMRLAVRPELDNGTARDAEVTEGDGQRERALIEGTVRKEPGGTAGAGEILDGGVVKNLAANSVGLRGGGCGDVEGEKKAEKQKWVLHGQLLNTNNSCCSHQ